MKYQLLVPNIGVLNVKETINFYTQILGFREIDSFSIGEEIVWVMINAGNANLMFHKQESLIEEYEELKERTTQSTTTYYVKVRNKGELYNKICNTEYLVKKMHTTSYGVEEFAIRDNNGIILVVAEEDSTVKNYDNFFLPVDDYKKAKQFYSETLGLKIKFEFEQQGMVAFAVGDEEPAIILKDKTKFPEAEPTIWIEVDNVKQMYKILVEKNVAFISEPFRIRTGWAVEFIDSSGNRLGITDYLQS